MDHHQAQQELLKCENYGARQEEKHHHSLGPSSNGAGNDSGATLCIHQVWLPRSVTRTSASCIIIHLKHYQAQQEVTVESQQAFLKCGYFTARHEFR